MYILGIVADWKVWYCVSIESDIRTPMHGIPSAAMLIVLTAD